VLSKAGSGRFSGSPALPAVRRQLHTYGFWGPRWRYRGAAFGWRTWDPWYGDPFWTDTVDVRTVDQYEASAEIVMRRGPARQDDVRAFNAREVLAGLGPDIIRPA
jgi:hypothetical protein